MRHVWHPIVAIIGLSAGTSAGSACLQSGESNVQLQILGSGGPDTAGRASASYLLWIDGMSRIMVDAGGGAAHQFRRAGARVDDIELVAVSHLHPDHSVDLPALLWPEGGSFSVSGPTGAGAFPSVEDFLERLFGTGGAYHVLAEEIDLTPVTVDVTEGHPVEVWRAGGILIQGSGVPHGDDRIDMDDRSIAFASDQNGTDPAFIDFIREVDLLVIHLGGTEDATGEIAALHARPSVWGAMAAAANVGHVVVSHIGTSSAEQLNTDLAILRDHFDGTISVAEDLMCIDVE